MSGLFTLAARVRAWIGRRGLDEDFAAELDSHVDLLTEEHLRRGLSLEEARRTAIIRVGGRTALAQAHRDVRGLPVLDALLQDSRFALRLIARAPWFTGAAVLALALGIGANTVGFTIINAAFLRGFSFDDADRLFAVSWRAESGRRRGLSPVELEDWRAASPSFEGLAGYRIAAANISHEGMSPVQLQGAWVTANHFDLLRVVPIIGRGFTTADERRDADPVAIIGDAVWREHFNRDPGALGATIRVDGQPTTIVGVMAEAMRFPEGSDIWLPEGLDATAPRDRRTLVAFGRLAAGASRASAEAELRALATNLQIAHRDDMAGLAGVNVETFVDRYLGGAARPMFITVMGAVILVLLVACVNVANLMVSRSAHRGREIAVRFSMGATRGRIVRQLLVESVLVSTLGGAAGLALATASVRAFDNAVRATGAPYWLAFTIDYRVLAYVASICVLTGVVFGLVPALQISSTQPADVLKDGSRGSIGSRRSRRLTAGLVIAQLALAVVLLSGAGLMIRSFGVLAAADTGVDESSLMHMRLQLPPSKYAGPDERRAFVERLESRVEAIPGILGAAVTTAAPPRVGDGGRIQTDRDPDADPVFVSTVTVTPDYFDVLEVPVRRGRDFTLQDGAPGADVVIVNQPLAARLFPDVDPIGRRIRFPPRPEDSPNAPDPAWRTIIGVSGPVLQGPAADAFKADVVYMPLRHDTPHIVSLLVRTGLPPEAVMASVRREVAAIDPDQPVFTIQTIAQSLQEERRVFGIFAVLFTVLAVIAITLSSVGLYAAMACAVTERTPEIGLRMALGAGRRQVSWLFLRTGLTQVVIGLAMGVPAALALARLARFRLVEIEPTDPVTLLSVVGVFTAVAVAACLVPVRQAARIEPIETLRGE